LVPPGIPKFRKSMEEKYYFTRSLFDYVKFQAAYGDHLSDETGALFSHANSF
jgi:hypothetical protein